MMLGLGAFSLAAGMFHLFTHAFFKALLFLAAGSVIHSAHTQDLREMGGLRHSMPVTFWTTVIASLSLAGVIPFAGFWSKDKVLAVAVAQAAEAPIHWLFVIFALATVLMTAFYMFRLVFLAFGGTFRGHGHPHESPAVMTIPLIILAVPSIIAGFWGSPWWPAYGFVGYLEGEHAQAIVIKWPVAVGAVALAGVGILLAYLMYSKGSISPVAVGRRLAPLYTATYRRWWIDEAYGWLSNRAIHGASTLISRFDRRVIDAAVDGVGTSLSYTGEALRRLQTGRVQSYGLVLFAGAAVIAIVVIVFGPGLRL
jgi:NADH-quinone oxidoreductase subunit L